jgi:poly(A) polymerase
MDVQDTAREIVKKLNHAGFVAYFAGGWVRDHLMGHPSDDIDIASNAPPEKILDLFPRTLLVGLSFGVVVVLEGGHQFEVATFRRDLDYSNGRAPAQIELATAEEDASRRDFTINGMFYDPVEHVVHDFVHGAEDIKNKVIRAIGNPYERFVEDRLRMIRAVRFAARFGFIIEPDTQEAIIANADALFPPVALERIWQELIKMSKYPNFDTAIIEMHRLGLLSVIFPSLQGMHLNVIKNAVSGFKHFPKATETILYLLELFPQMTINEAKEFCLYLRNSKADYNLAAYILSMRKALDSEQALEIVDLHTWAHLYGHQASGKCLEIIASKMPLQERDDFLNKHKERRNQLNKHIGRIIEKKPLVNAALLQANGVNPGRQMGILMKEAERLAIMNDLNEPEQVLESLKTTHAWLI